MLPTLGITPQIEPCVCSLMAFAGQHFHHCLPIGVGDVGPGFDCPLWNCRFFRRGLRVVSDMSYPLGLLVH